MADRQFLEQLSRKLADEGRLIEAGWVALRIQAVPLNAPPVQLTEMRKAFMAGAQHLWASINSILEPNAEPTVNDLRRMSLIDDELSEFYKALQAELLRTQKPEGSA